MIYKNTISGVFLERVHRFGALVDISGSVEYVHVRNTGRCKELLITGTKVILEKSDNPKRKTGYSLISVYKGSMLVNIDSQIPNRVIFDALKKECLLKFQNMSFIKREVTFGSSRFDIYFEKGSGVRGFIEIKGVTLDIEGTAMFPDAPTMRGKKHLFELIKAKNQGYKAHIVFLIQYKPADIFRPNYSMDPEFSKALKQAVNAGVQVHAFDSIVTENSIDIGREVPLEI